MLFESIGFPVAIMAIIAGILGLVITWIFKLFETKVDERVQEVSEALPGAIVGLVVFLAVPVMLKPYVMVAKQILHVVV